MSAPHVPARAAPRAGPMSTRRCQSPPDDDEPAVAPVAAVADLMATGGRPMGQPNLEAQFRARGRLRERLSQIFDTLEAMGRVRRVEGAAGLLQAG